MRLRVLFAAALILLLVGHSGFAVEPDPKSRPTKGALEPIDLSPFSEDYHPVKKSQETIQFFPDDVEWSVEQAIIAGYEGHIWEIDSYYRSLRKHDRNLLRRGEQPTGLADDMLQFRNSHISDPKAYREAQERVLSQKGLSKEMRRVITYRLKNAELARAERLLHEDKLAKVAMVVNGFLQSLDLVALTVGSVVGSTVDAAVRTFVSLEDIREMSVKEKKALAEYKTYLAKHPKALDADKVRAEVERLEAKKRHWAFREEMEKAAEHLGAHDHDDAQAAYSRALELKPGSREALEGLTKVDELRAEYEAAMDRSLKVVRGRGGPKNRVEEAAYRQLLSAVAAGDNEAVRLRATEFMERHPKSQFRDEAAYALASAVAVSGDYEEAKRLMDKTARDYGDRNMGRRAQLVLSSQEFDRLGAFYAAQREHRRKQVQYALIGEDLARKNADFGVYRLFIDGIKSVETLGMVNLLGATMRTVELVSRDPISNDPIIEEGLKFSHNHPGAPEVKEVYYQLAKAYEREQKYIDALAYYQLSGRASERKIAGLREKAARNLLAQATMAPNSVMKARLYRAIIEQFPETKPVAKAKERLVAIAKQYQDRFRLSRKYLLSHPEIAGPQGLNLDPNLLDGDTSNREIHDKGIVLLSGNRMKIFFNLPDGSESSKVFLLHPNVVARLAGLTRDLDRKRAYALSEKYGIDGPLVATHGSFAGTLEAEKRYNPFVVEEINDAPGNVYLSDAELRQYEETLYANLGADISSDLRELSTGGALYFRRYGAGVNFGLDQESPNVGALVPLGFFEINTKMRPTGFSIYPSIRIDSKPVPDEYLYK
ncbi:MAG: hypothetical protein ACE1ZU_04765 [bacterium]